jgi:hypothetical protein
VSAIHQRRDRGKGFSLRGFEHLTAGDVATLGKQAIAKPSKYRNVKVVVGTETFDSKREAAYWVGLQARERAGEIRWLRRQVAFPLLAPARKGGATDYAMVAFYLADFVFEELDEREFKDPDPRAWVSKVVDAKGARTAIYKLKRKWLELQDGIVIEEV